MVDVTVFPTSALLSATELTINEGDNLADSLGVGNYNIVRTDAIGAFSVASSSRAILLVEAGQSNMTAAGTEAVDATIRGYDLSNSFVFNETADDFVALTVGTGGNANPTDLDPERWSHEAQLITRLRAAYPERPIYLVKLADGGSTIRSVGGDDWAFPNGELYNRLLDMLNRARTILGTGNYDAYFLWHQGGAEVKSASTALEYADNFPAWWDNMRGTLIPESLMNMKFRIRIYDASTHLVENAVICRLVEEQYFDQLASSTNRLLESDYYTNGEPDYGPSDARDQLHPGADWVDLLGDRAADAILGGTDWRPIDGTPNAFAFTDVTDATGGVVVTSDAIVLDGLDIGATITITGGEYRITNYTGSVSVDWTSAPGVYHPSQTVQVRASSDPDEADSVSVQLTVGGVVSTWTVTTATAGSGVAPVNTAAPAITGTSEQGQTLTASGDTWDNVPTSYDFQWTRDGVDIPGATTRNYTLTADDVGTVPGFYMTATNAYGTSDPVAATGGSVVAAASGGSYPAGIADIGSGAWYDLQDVASVTLASGVTVETIADQTPNARTITTPYTEAPSYDPAVLLNGHRSLDVGQQVAHSASLASVFAGATWSFTTFAAVDTTNTSIMLEVRSADGLIYIQLGYRNNGNYRLYSSDGNADIGAYAPSNTPAAVTWNYDGTNLTVFRNGVQIASAAKVLGSLAVVEANLFGIANETFKMTADVGEMIAVPRNLTAQEITDLHSYLSARWAAA